MAPRRNQGEPFDGIDIELPFIAFRFGGRAWRAGMNDDEAYERARRRVRARLSFYRHLATYAAVIVAILFIDLVTGGGVSGFVLWVAGIWGGFLVFHFANAFVFPSLWSRETEARMIEEELRRQRGE